MLYIIYMLYVICYICYMLYVIHYIYILHVFAHFHIFPNIFSLYFLSFIHIFVVFLLTDPNTVPCPLGHQCLSSNHRYFDEHLDVLVHIDTLMFPSWPSANVMLVEITKATHNIFYQELYRKLNNTTYNQFYNCFLQRTRYYIIIK